MQHATPPHSSTHPSPHTQQVRVAYVETMGRTVFALFRAYHAQLQKLVLEVANKVRRGFEGMVAWWWKQEAARVAWVAWLAWLAWLGLVAVTYYAPHNPPPRTSTPKQNDLIAVEEGAVRGLFTTKVDLSKRGDAFSLADRDKILEQVEAEPILVHIAQAEVRGWMYGWVWRDSGVSAVRVRGCVGRR